MNTEKENKNRIKQIIGYAVSKGVTSSQKDFGRILGYENESSFSQILNKVPLSNELIQKIKDVLPEINTEWLQSGDGNMLNSEIKNVSAPVQVGGHINANSTIDKALDEIAAQRRINEKLQDKIFELIDKLTEK